MSNSILNILEKYKKSVYEKDVESFLSIYDADIFVFDMWGEWSHQGVAVWKKMAEEWFSSLGSEKVVVDMDQIQIKSSESIAYVTAFLKFSAVSEKGEVLRYLQNRLTCVLENKNGNWKIVHEHTSGPVDHATLKVSLKRS